MSSAIFDSVYAKRITVFTPTYNRAYTLGKLYSSLQRQSFTDFEWLVVDDGSSDDTETLVSGWANENNAFPIRFVKQKNGGKHRAVNHGLELAEGEIFFVVDSDDYITDDALDKIDRWFHEIENDSTLVAIAANKGISVSETPNELFDERYIDSNFLKMQTYRENGRLVLDGEKAIAFYTSIHRQYPYPEFENEKFMTEAVVYNRMAHDGYETRFYNDIICIYQYMDDGLSARGSDNYIKNPHGYGLWFNEKSAFLKYPLMKKCKMWYTFYCDLKDEREIREIAECVGAPAYAIRSAAVLHRFLRFIKGRDAFSSRDRKKNLE